MLKEKIFKTQYLVFGIVILIIGQLFFVNGIADKLLTTITVIITLIISIILFKNLKRESDQRMHIEQLSELLKSSKQYVEETNTKLEDANQKLKSLDQLKTEFVSLASHQLRSPLTAIKGYASMLADGDYGDMSKEAKDAVDRIFQSSKSLTIIVEDLLNVTKIESGGMKYEMTSFNLSKIVEDEVKDLSIAAENKGLKLNLIQDENQSCIVNGDKEKIRQIIINFIDNSIKYTKEGNIDISIVNKDDKILFSVKDTGIGMTPEIKSTLFHKFTRGDGARMNTSGSGLGLYLAKEIALAHKGRVWVESDGLDKGSIFYLELDAVK
jgi:signal transduction histidine kinase